MYGIALKSISLEEYWAYVQVSEGAGYGIAGCPDYEDDSCSLLWNQRQRSWFAKALNMFSDRMMNDRWLGFPIRRTYQGVRRIPYSYPLYLGKYLRGIGVEAESDIQIGAVISLRDGAGDIIDPIVLYVVTAVTNPNEVILYYPGQTKYVIRPSEVVISGGVATITIPRVRLLQPVWFANRDVTTTPGPTYQDDANFLTSVDIVRNYLNTATGMNIVWDSLNTPCTTANSTAIRQLATAEIRDQRNGIAQLTLNAQSYTVCRDPNGIEVNFMRGKYDRYEELDEEIMRAACGFAHSNVPEEHCRQCLEGRLFFLHDTKLLEPPVNLRLGPSTWGIFEAVQVIKEYDRDRNSHGGGML